MSAPQFTPGQWTYGVRDDGSIWQSRGNPLEGAHYQDDFHGTEADARLIAAAPELYEALERAAALIGGPASFAGLSSDDEVEHTVRVRIDDVIRFRAALAKARGEQA